ncbi:hypothetical protein TARUN_386 [Trichoderma arundinaceum]|uniref:Uncharacterized protein n=1 Tax=Trichoderma arundinaceum TaxID=490622 RepID=A0A395P0C1_TRIAR|nr:hypothetical protein TARUN_386 [Trichoderma arundinaceum]
MKFQTLASLLFSAASTVSGSAAAQDSSCPPGRVGDWFSMAVYPQIHNATYDSTFNTEYYSQQQMPWICSLWKPFGMKGYTITGFNRESIYSTATLLYFSTPEQFDAALADSGEEILERVKLFSSETPTHYVGEVLYTVV